MEGTSPPPGMDESSLSCMKQSALQKWASEIGATPAEFEAAVDSPDAKSALISLILRKAKQGGLSAMRPAPIETAPASTDPVRLAVDDDGVISMAQSKSTPASRQSLKSKSSSSNSRRDARRGSDDTRSRRSSAQSSRRESYGSTAYDSPTSGFPSTPMGFPSTPMTPFHPYAGMMPPPMGMVPPMGPLGFPDPNPWLTAAAALGQMTGIPMTPPFGYPNPLMPPAFGPEFGYPGYTPEVYPPYPMQPSTSTERRGSTTSTKSDRSQRKTPKGYTAQSAAQKADQAETKPVNPEEQTTLLLRNLPEAFTRSQLENILNAKSFKGRYDFIYLSVNLRTKLNFGYAFVNFVTHTDAQECCDLLHGYTSWDVPSDKVCEASWSSLHQGLPALIECCRNNPVMHESVDDEFKPALFSPGTGDRAVFPAPTQKLRVRRLRRPAADGAEKKDDNAAQQEKPNNHAE